MPPYASYPTWSRRSFLKTAGFLSGGIAIAGLPGSASQGAVKAGIAASDLPRGSAPQPLQFPHFPTRLHAFVWRNWQLVPVERQAKVVGAKESEIERIGRAMGLGHPPKISASVRARAYITVIRRNWHLLPYDQLLTLLGWTADEMAYVLREDDFLYIKLGNLKPACAPLRYQEPTEAALALEKHIRDLVRRELPALSSRPDEPLFGFLADLNRKSRPGRSNEGPLRFCYSYFALYGDPLLNTAADPYPDEFLSQLASAGVNGVWLQAVLYKLARFPWDPSLSASHEERLKNLAGLVSRAEKHGIRVFLYLNEPRSMPLRFFERHPELKGTVEGEHAALCTSQIEVQTYLRESVAAICRAVPGLGGFFTITASENFTNCWSHGQGNGCPRCATRNPGEVVAEVNSLLWQGISRAGTQARLIAWDWGWADDWAPRAIESLPQAVSFMSVSEWNLPVERGGVRTSVGEYSISAIGPGPRATVHWELAAKRGLSCVAKIQAGNTWELASVPYIPAVANVAQHAENLRRAGVSEQMLGWTLGGYPSPNLEVVRETGQSGSAREAMLRVAGRRYGAGLADAFLQAWQKFSTAFSEFPYHIGVVYSGPQQMGPANLLFEKATGYRATMVCFPYDDLDGWRSVYPPEVFAQQFEKVAAGFELALNELEAAVAAAPVTGAQRSAAVRECRVAEAVMIHFRSCANQVRYVMARNALAAAQEASAAERQRATARTALEEELRLAKRLHYLQTHDSRLGFEASNHYFYIPADLGEKILNCHHLLKQLS